MSIAIQSWGNEVLEFRIWQLKDIGDLDKYSLEVIGMKV